jgi:hypothetical protein
VTGESPLESGPFQKSSVPASPGTADTRVGGPGTAPVTVVNVVEPVTAVIVVDDSPADAPATRTAAATPAASNDTPTSATRPRFTALTSSTLGRGLPQVNPVTI